MLQNCRMAYWKPKIIGICFGSPYYDWKLAQKDSPQFLIQCEVKPKPIVTRLRVFSRASHRLHVIRDLIGLLDWLCPLWLARVIDCFGFDFMTLSRPFPTNGHMVQNPPYWRVSLLLFPRWEIQNKEMLNLTGQSRFVLEAVTFFCPPVRRSFYHVIVCWKGPTDNCSIFALNMN